MAGERKGEEPSLDEKPSGEVGDDENDDIRIPIQMLLESAFEAQVRGDGDDDDWSSMAWPHEKYSRSSDLSIFKVPCQLRQLNPSAYEPRIFSIGPYHRNKTCLTEMEIHKLSYLHMLLQRRNEISLIEYVTVMRKLEDRARSCYAYASTKRMSSKEFVKMLVLDGCFVIELIRKFASKELRFEGDDPFKLSFNLSIVGQELLLVENQLPFFVLEKLFDMTKPPNENESLETMAFMFLSSILPKPWIGVVNCRYPSVLIGLVYDNGPPSSEGGEGNEFELVTATNWNFIRSTKELLEFGIKFKKVISPIGSSFDIKFKDGRFQIPTLTICHDTERIFQNRIAYEQFNKGGTCFMDYARLMGCLINDAEDVKLLSLCGIIDNRLRTNEAVAHMFNKLNDFVSLSKTDFKDSRSMIFREVNEYCHSRSWKARLRNKYLRSPWDWVLASILAGALAVLLAFMQTVFTVLSYVKQ